MVMQPAHGWLVVPLSTSSPKNMRTTAMHFAMLIPNWNSLDSVRHAHSELEGAALVFFALLVFFEALAHVSEDKKRERLLEKVGLWFFAVAVFCEMAAYPYGQRNDTLSEQIIGSLDIKARDAFTNASSALTKSGEAETKADDAETKSVNAVTASSNAHGLAKGARKEADTFELDIASAKKQAAEAESHLAEAMQRAKQLTTELDRLTTPRHLFHKARIAPALKLFPGTEYMFVGTCGDQECFGLLSDIDELLQLAGWKRTKGPVMRIGITQYLINGNKDFAVDESVSLGTVILAEVPNGYDSVKALPENQLPQHLRAAIVLNQELASNIEPAENTGTPVKVDIGTSTVVKIDVGRKPL